jgi:hypothetical protein
VLEPVLAPAGLGPHAAAPTGPLHVALVLGSVLRAADFGDRAPADDAEGAPGHSAAADALTATYAQAREGTGRF